MSRIATERLYRTADGRVVREGDPEAAFLLAAPGHLIPDGYELPADKAVPEPVAEPVLPVEEIVVAIVDDEAKAVAKPANKATPAPANKGRGR